MNAGFSPDERCLIGVSGGPDSVALLHKLRDEGFQELVVCHLDHGLRSESGTDAEFVERLARELGCEFHCDRVEIAALAKRQKRSIETTGRHARYEFFAKAAEYYKSPRLFLAHQADDQVETFISNLFRGTSATGLRGMRWMSTQNVGDVPLSVSRPLLGTWRDEIIEYLEKHGINYLEDHSNADRRHTRNRLRHDIIPLLEKTFGREIRRAIWRAAEILHAEDELLHAQLGDEAPPVEFAVAYLKSQHLAIQRRRLHAWLKARGIPDVGFAEVESVRRLLDGRTAKTNLPGGWHARRRAGKLFLERLSD
jgi:tRNA(Ile)-lysidine synthase